jgi:hypothetical protein
VAHYGSLGTYQFSQTAEDIRGAALYGLNDEKLGKIDDVIFNHSTGDIQYVVVDTGGWLRTKKFVVPASHLSVSREHEGDFSSDLTKKRIESLPPYQESDLNSEENWTDYDRRYRSHWETSPVMHRAETDRNITPTTPQMEGNQSSLRASGSPTRTSPGALSDEDEENEELEAASAPTERVVPAGSDSVVIENSAVGLGGRMDVFQARLRERRKEAVAACRSCSVGPASVRGSENAADQKKAI